jgi:hypothetical protein
MCERDRERDREREREERCVREIKIDRTIFVSFFSSFQFRRFGRRGEEEKEPARYLIFSNGPLESGKQNGFSIIRLRNFQKSICF